MSDSETSGTASDSEESGTANEEQPLLRVVKGDPTSAELAALVAVVASREGPAPGETGPSTRSAWGDPARAVRTLMNIGPGGWRRSAFPR